VTIVSPPVGTIAPPHTVSARLYADAVATSAAPSNAANVRGTGTSARMRSSTCGSAAGSLPNTSRTQAMTAGSSASVIARTVSSVTVGLERIRRSLSSRRGRAPRRRLAA
jgi:hypothetical protein